VSEVVAYAVIGFERDFQFFLHNLAMKVLSFPLYVKVAHFCFVSLLLGFYGEGADIQLFCEWLRKRIIVHNIMNTIKKTLHSRARAA